MHSLRRPAGAAPLQLAEVEPGSLVVGALALSAVRPGHRVGGRAARGPHPLGRWGQPAELAPAYVFLASPESSYVIGETLHVNGGMPTP